MNDILAYLCVECLVQAGVFYAILRVPQTRALVAGNDMMMAATVGGLGMISKPLSKFVLDMIPM